jgi:S1-C subfamily serine protease
MNKLLFVIIFLFSVGGVVRAELLTPLERHKHEQEEKIKFEKSLKEGQQALDTMAARSNAAETKDFIEKTKREAEEKPFNYILLALWSHKDGDYETARMYYTKATASKDFTTACTATLQLGEMIMRGEGVSPNKTLAMMAFKTLIFTHGKGAYFYALGCLSGEGVEHDYTSGIEILKNIKAHAYEDKGTFHCLPYPNALDSILECNKIIPAGYAKELWEETVSNPDKASDTNLFYSALCSYVGKFASRNVEDCYRLLGITRQPQIIELTKLLYFEFRTFCEGGAEACVDAPYLTQLSEKNGKSIEESYIYYLTLLAKNSSETFYKHSLASEYYVGAHTMRNTKKAIELYMDAALSGSVDAQYDLATIYASGDGVIKNDYEAYKWLLLAGNNGKSVSKDLEALERKLTSNEIRLARRFASDPKSPLGDDTSRAPHASGSGLLINNGYILTCWHVVENAGHISIHHQGSDYIATIARKDAANDLAILQISSPLNGYGLTLSDVKLASTVFTLGYPQPELQGSDIKFTTGTISGLTGTDGTPLYYQISVPLQPGNSGGPLFDNKGNLVGVVAAKLNSLTALALTGEIPQNVNYAIKTDYLRPLLKTIEEIKIESPKEKEIDLLSLIDELKKSVVMIRTY